MKINDKIFDFLTKRDANLSDLAKKVDMDYSNFHKILKGKRKMPIEILKRLKEEYPSCCSVPLLFMKMIQLLRML